ncbi:hypothetical protein I317_04737 [Kwoniella heveanensis CBS 569]|nr:hypothetical protein I317_04737 [Kwoniella heveanensis CBS 569]
MGSPRSQLPDIPPSSIPIPGGWMISMGSNAVAGPSSEGALPRKPSTSSPPKSPSSAPPTPSVISVTHPSQYIHTHHPRRGSMTPLGLNLISPVPPPGYRDGAQQPSTSRSVGFQPGYNVVGGGDLVGISPPNHHLAHRRGSAASTTSTLTQSRPPPHIQPQHAFYPPNWNAGRRRSSLTPSGPSLAAPSPTRAHANGKSSRPVSSDGSNAPSLRGFPKGTELGHDHSRQDGPPGPTSTNSDVYARRGSLPHLGYGGWTGHQRVWNPVLPPPRGSVGEGHQEDALSDFKFGSVSGPSAAAAALRNVELSPESGRRASLKRKEDLDVFEQAEEEEAERQRRAFLAATYGADGKRARERLSIGGQSGQGPSPGTPAGGLRRQSLMLWERMGMNRAMEDASPSSAPPVPSSSLTPGSLLSESDFGQRRGSLPIAIPGGGLGRTSSRRSNRDINKHASPSNTNPDASMDTAEESEEEEEEENEDEEAQGDYLTGPSNNLAAPVRPLPPLLPLSDPGPRLLPSTLALHRANHLLQSRNLQSEPLPHPLPPSLHPPDPVDVAEFDIDFILAGSQAQLGGQVKTKNAPVDILRTAPSHDYLATPTLRLGGEEEDTFAKFVGEFDDEYGGRRGEWTFRSCPAAHPGSLSPVDPLEQSSKAHPKAEWESSGAGKYELFPNGEVRSIATGTTWRVYRLGNREYELEEIKPVAHQAASPAGAYSGGERYALAGKSVHRDQGGVKLPHFNIKSWLQHSHSQMSDSTIPSTASLSGVRVVIDDSPKVERTERLDSQASTVTMTPALSQSAPFGGHPMLATASSSSKKDRKEESTPAAKEEKHKSKVLSRQRSKEDSEGKKEKGLGNVLKRGFFSSIKHSSLGGSSEEKRLQKEQRQERERERAQAHSWSGASNIQHHGWFSGSSRGSDGMTYRGPSPSDRQPTQSVQTTSSHSAASSSDDSRSAPWSSGETHARTVSSSATSGEGDFYENLRHWPNWREGKAWAGVPEEAVAMIIPLEEMAATRPSLASQPPSAHPFFMEGSKQVLLVWYVPFNSEYDDSEARPSTASSRASTSDPSPQSSVSGSAIQVGSMPKLQKLLRRRVSKDKDVLKKETQGLSNTQSPSKPLRQGPAYPPLPFRSFRVVARVVNTEDLRSEADSNPPSASTSKPVSPFENWNKSKDQNLFLSSANPTSTASTSPSTHPSPSFQAQTKAQDAVTTQVAMTGRNMPTVIAVCHSRAQGVEFVLEGLDRLGLCKGESAWGPTGYEEWRGTGLSEKGRQLLDILWAGCTGVMGLSAL